MKKSCASQEYLLFLHQKALEAKKEGLSDAIKTLEDKPTYVKDENLEKYRMMMKTTVETVNILLSRKSDATEVIVKLQLRIYIVKQKLLWRKST